MVKIEIKKDCKNFLGDTPCNFHKKEDSKCMCKHYIKTGKRILIIKLKEAGDVIRTTPLLRKLKTAYLNCEITWVTYFPEILSKSVDRIFRFNVSSIVTLMADEFDIIYNLDKGAEACALMNLVKAKTKKGFNLVKGKCNPIDQDAQHKFFTGLNDNLNKRNKKSYVEEIFEVAGLPYSKEKYIIEKPECSVNLPEIKHPVIGLNTGCGKRWLARLWPEKNMVELAKKLLQQGYSVLLLGGSREDKKNRRIAKKSGAVYAGIFPLPDFINVVDKCELVVTGVTMCMHIAIGLNKKVVVLNSIFNKHEFELYELGEIIEPDVRCKVCYRDICSDNCMEKITAIEVFRVVKRLLQK